MLNHNIEHRDMNMKTQAFNELTIIALAHSLCASQINLTTTRESPSVSVCFASMKALLAFRSRLASLLVLLEPVQASGNGFSQTILV
jgi:hypothetical protein